jgi:magnesium transporter
MTSIRSDARLEHSLYEITRLLEKHRVLEDLAHRQEGPKRDLLEGLQHRQNLAELQRRLRTMHAADVAFVLEALSPDDRTTVWEQLDPEQAGRVFVELSEAVLHSVIETTPRDRLVGTLMTLDPDDLGYLSEALPSDVVNEVSAAFELVDRQAFEASTRYDEDQVGHHMSHEWIAVAETHTIQQALSELRKRGELPPQTDRLFVVDARNILRGALTLPTLLLTDPGSPVVGCVEPETVSFGPSERVHQAASAFERYDLVSAPVVDDRGKLVGRLTVDAVMDFVRDEAELRALKRAGLTREEDLFAPPLDSARNRAPWLAVNLVTAFLASRVIGQFEHTIRELAALATLMPIVASIGGNTGNQTMAVMIRALAGDQVRGPGAVRLLNKEVIVSLLNGTVWGLIVGIAASTLYSSLALGAVMTAAVVLNLLVAAVAGVTIPLGLHSRGRDPAFGSSVLLTFVTDAMGFFLFLGLATAFLS